MKTVGVVGRNVSTSPSSTLNGNDAATSLFQKFQCGRFGSLQFPRRKNGEMGRHVSQSRVEFLAQLFHKLANRITDVGHQRVA